MSRAKCSGGLGFDLGMRGRKDQGGRRRKEQERDRKKNQGLLVRLRRETQPALSHAVWKIAGNLDLEAILNKSLAKLA